jgi:uncharacterized OsmC-like protein
MARTGSFPVHFHASGTATGKMRNDVRVDWPAMKQSWDFATDEAPILGGEDTAPPPLAYLAVALIGCAMTNIRMMAPLFNVELRALSVSLDANWRRDVPQQGPHIAQTDGFALEIEVDSPASSDEVIALIGAARSGCFVEHSLSQAVPVVGKLKHGDSDWIAVPGPTG